VAVKPAGSAIAGAARTGCRIDISRPAQVRLVKSLSTGKLVAQHLQQRVSGSTSGACFWLFTVSIIMRNRTQVRVVAPIIATQRIHRDSVAPAIRGVRRGSGLRPATVPAYAG
jgi:hypothetical protein